MQLGDNTKAAVIRLGLMEMVRFTQEFFNKDTEVATFLESCGVADLITTCYGGRNRKVSEAYVKTGKVIFDIGHSFKKKISNLEFSCGFAVI